MGAKKTLILVIIIIIPLALKIIMNSRIRLVATCTISFFSSFLFDTVFATQHGHLFNSSKKKIREFSEHKDAPPPPRLQREQENGEREKKSTHRHNKTALQSLKTSLYSPDDSCHLGPRHPTPAHHPACLCDYSDRTNSCHHRTCLS